MLLTLPPDLNIDRQQDIVDTLLVYRNKEGGFYEPGKRFSTARWAQLGEAYADIIRENSTCTTQLYSIVENFNFELLSCSL